MAIAPVLQWLSDPNRTYHHGKLLYEQYGNNIVHQTIINTGHQASNFHFTYLENSLRAIADQGTTKSIVDIPDLQAFDKPEISGISDQEYSKLPEDLRTIRKDAKNNFNRAKFLFARIPLVDSKEERLTMALQLLNDFDRNREKMGHVQGFLDTGSFTPPVTVIKDLKAVSELTVRELIAESKNLPTYISKDRTRLDVAENDLRKEDLKNRIKARLERLEEIQRRLNE